MTRSSKVPYQGTTPGADSDDYVLFDTTVAFPGTVGKNMLQLAGIKRFIIDLAHSDNGTLEEYKSPDRGTTWIQVSTEAITASATATTVREYAVEPYDDWRLVWENGGSAQDPWVPDMVLDPEAF
jgi:hypothetical protein